MSTLLDIKAQGKDRAYTIPFRIACAMRAQGIKTPNALATRAGLNAMTVKRMLQGTRKHQHLQAYKKAADTLQWTLTQFFDVVLDNPISETREAIKQRLKDLGIGTKFFADTTGCGAYIFELSSPINSTYARIYRAVADALKLSDDLFYECLLIETGIESGASGVKLSSFGAAVTKDPVSQLLHVA